ncbi:MAG: hypothetical protein IKR18_00920 [Bacteroidaceae bacterium]|nr:hypothetical protein [Bacteroidaceae bacterium]
MNIYIRYFDQEVLVSDVEQAIDYLSSIPEVKLNDNIIKSLTSYVEGKSNYVRKIMLDRYNYFIAIKSDAETLEEFKARNEEKIQHKFGENGGLQPKPANRSRESILRDELVGWYEAGIIFKRVVQIPGTQKFTYQDTSFRAQMTARSGEECYQKIIEHLRDRDDVDLRSQFPSAKSNKFDFKYLGLTREG